MRYSYILEHLLIFEGHFCLSISYPVSVHLRSTLCYTLSYSKPLNICGLTKGLTELISVAKYSSNDRPHTEGEEGKEDQRKVKVARL